MAELKECYERLGEVLTENYLRHKN